MEILFHGSNSAIKMSNIMELDEGVKLFGRREHLKNNHGAQCLARHQLSDKAYEMTFLLLMKNTQADYFAFIITIFFCSSNKGA